MPAFVRVDASQAGANALGILVPPGEATMVIVRPRPLPWDLLPASWDGQSGSAPRFCRFGRDEAARVARQLHGMLEACVAEGRSPVETFGDGRHFQVWLRTSQWLWILCARTPGLAYQPAVFTTGADAVDAAQQVQCFVWPAADGQQEIYFNTQLVGQALLPVHAEDIKRRTAAASGSL